MITHRTDRATFIATKHQTPNTLTQSHMSSEEMPTAAETTVSSARTVSLEGAERERDLDAFAAQYELQLNRKKRRQLLQESTYEQYEAYKTGLEVSFCCKNADLDKAREVYQRATALDLRLAAHSYNNLLCLAAGLGEPGNGSQTQRCLSAEPAQDAALATRIYEDMQRLGVAPSEASCSALIRCYCQSGRAEYEAQAMRIYERMKEQQIAPKQRTFTALLQFFASTRVDEAQCFALFAEMKERFEIAPSEKEYLSLLRVSLSTGDSERFYAVLEEMMEELLLLYSHETLQLVSRWFCEREHGFVRVEAPVDEQGVCAPTGQRLCSVDLPEETQRALLEKLQSMAVYRDPNHKHKPNNKILQLQQMKAQQREEKHKKHQQRGDENGNESTQASNESTASVAEGEAASEAAVSNEDAIASAEATNVDGERPALENEKVTEDDKERGADNENAAEKRVDPERQAQWQHFVDTINSQEYDIIIDGANVGYFNQNYANAPNHVDYLQIHQMVRFIADKCRKKPLLVLHSRHIQDFVTRTVSPYTYESLSPLDCSRTESTRITAQEMIAEWRERGFLYATPRSFNDDWFWMYAAVRLGIPVVTNDEMRDHHFQLLSPRYFTRWRERHRVRYGFFYRYPAALRHLLPGNNNNNNSSHSNSNNNTNNINNHKSALVRDADSEEDEEADLDRSEEEEEIKTTRARPASLPLSRPLFAHNNRQLVHFNPAYRQIALHWPLPYSFRMQRVQCALGTGFYFPAVVEKLPTYAAPLPKDETHKTDDKNKSKNKEKHTDGAAAAAAVKVVDPHVSTAELIENMPIADKERLRLPWVVFFRGSCSASGKQTALGKRAREPCEVDSGKLFRQITKDY